MSGSERGNGTAGILMNLESLLRRDSPLSAFRQIATNLQASKDDYKSFNKLAICLDSCVLLHLYNRKDLEDIFDYFSEKHDIPLIVSAQSLQEFWNNHIFSVETIASALERKFTELEREVEKVDDGFGDFSSQFKALISRFKDDYGHLHDRRVRKKLIDLVERLAGVASVYEVPRSRFYAYAAIRQSLKTPPGFKDSGDGDYFVWVDFLFGLASLKEDGHAIERAIMVTDDKKSDWSKGGVPHPVLSAEVEACIGVPFETWSLDKFAQLVQRQIANQ